MRKSIAWLPALTCLALVLSVPPALAGSAHFVGDVVISRDGNTISASGKIAGLGSEAQVHVVLTFSAACINPGSNRPKADNKSSFSAEGDFPVQNGKADFSLSGTATFKPDCTPPMTLVFSDVSVCDTTHNLCVTRANP